MHKLVLILFFQTIFANANGQIIKTIRFIHTGDELKPVGTLLISTEKYIRPGDRGLLDTVFGVGIKTDENTFKMIDSFIGKYQFNVKAKDQFDINGYKIINSKNAIFYLRQSAEQQFFINLRNFITANNLDNKIFKELGYHVKAKRLTAS